MEMSSLLYILSCELSELVRHLEHPGVRSPVEGHSADLADLPARLISPQRTSALQSVAVLHHVALQPVVVFPTFTRGARFVPV